MSSTAAPPTPYPTPDPPAAGGVFAAIETAVASVVLAEPLTVTSANFSTHSRREVGIGRLSLLALG